MKINKDKAWLIFYVTTAFMLGILIMACQAEKIDETEDNFLEVYNGIIWKNNGSGDADDWYIFTTQGLEFIEYVSNFYGCESDVYKWGVESSEGGIINIKENSKNILKLQYLEDNNSNDNYLMTITASENGDTINIIYSDEPNNSYNYNRVSQGCK